MENHDKDEKERGGINCTKTKRYSTFKTFLVVLFVILAGTILFVINRCKNGICKSKLEPKLEMNDTYDQIHEEENIIRK
jgi:hypothetical protein